MVAQPGEARYRLELPADCKAHPVFHVSRLKTWTDPDMVKFKGQTRKLPRAFKEGDKMEVLKLHDDDNKYGVQWYLVEWKGWPRRQDWTWQAREDLLPGSIKLLEKYDNAHGIEEGKGERKRTRRKPTR